MPEARRLTLLLPGAKSINDAGPMSKFSIYIYLYERIFICVDRVRQRLHLFIVSYKN